MNAGNSIRKMFCAFCVTITTVLPVLGEGVSQGQSIAASNNKFAFDIYARLSTNNGNLFFSPYSISTCLAMTYAGARGNTEAQMAQVFHFGEQTNLHAAFGELQAQLNAIQAKKKIELNIANGLWAQRGKAFLPAFLDIAQKQYGAEVEKADFRTAGEAVRKTINDWVSDKTKGKILDLIPPRSLGPMTRLVLVNAIYFKGPWVLPFRKGNTHEAPFHLNAEKAMPAQLMNQTDHFMYAENEELQLLELGYANHDISMVVLLPRKVDGLKALEAQLNAQQYESWLAKLHIQEVIVGLPKFKLTSSVELNKYLVDLGMPDAFSGAANFSGMDGTRQLFISKVIHKAFVDVNEEGTEAAAATAVAMTPMAIRRETPVVFRADHPFIFLIRDTHSGSVLFIGRMTGPEK